jgi:hypothetical protein
VNIKPNGSIELIETQAHERYFRRWMLRLPDEAFKRICEALNKYIDEKGNGEIITTSWVPGADWTNTPYEPIYDAVGQSWESARFFFGLIVWQLMMSRSEYWAFGRYPRHEGDIIGLTYFRVQFNGTNRFGLPGSLRCQI